MLLGELQSPPKNLTPLVPSAVSESKADDFVNVMKEDSFSDSDQVFLLWLLLFGHQCHVTMVTVTLVT